MDPPALSQGALKIILSNGRFDKPVLQILSLKQTGTDKSTGIRYRLHLSDGVSSSSSVLLSDQLKGLVDSKDLDTNSVIRADQYTIADTKSSNPQKRYVMMILDVRVLARGDAVGRRIGNPESLVSGGSSASGPSKQEPAAASNIGITTSHAEQKPQQPFGLAGPSMYGKPQSNTAVSNSNVRPGSPTNTGPAAKQPRRVFGIEALSPYQNRWTIRARVSVKNDIRTWSNSRGEGKLFTFNLVDETAEIRVTAFRNEVDKFFDQIEQGKVYYISKATVRNANKQYSHLKNDYELVLTADTEITECVDTTSTDIPKERYSFTGIDQLVNLAPDSFTDVIGVVHNVGDLSSVTGRSSGKQVSKRELELVDATGVLLKATIWAEQAENFDLPGSPSPAVVAIKNGKVSDFGGRTISLTFGSQLVINPDITEAHRLRDWYQREGDTMNFATFRNADSGGGTGAGPTVYRCLREVKDMFGGGNEGTVANFSADTRAEYYTTRATIMATRKENCVYKACPKSDCNKKVVDQGNGLYRCEKCNMEFPDFSYRFLLQINICDTFDDMWVTLFGDTAEKLLNGTSAQEVGEAKENDETKFEKIFARASFQRWMFRLRSKMESFNDEVRLKTVCVGVNPVNSVEEMERQNTNMERFKAFL